GRPQQGLTSGIGSPKGGGRANSPPPAFSLRSGRPRLELEQSAFALVARQPCRRRELGARLVSTAESQQELTARRREQVIAAQCARRVQSVEDAQSGCRTG